MSKLRRWPIPPSRLPFVNQDVTPIQFRSSPGIVSSVWGGPQGGRIYVWNPDTHEAQESCLPERVMGAYMLKTAPDGRLYLGGGNGELMRCDPQTEQIETLVTGEMSGITWGGCVTDRYAIWSASPGDVCVYDWKENKLVKVFRQIDTESPASLYAHIVVTAPDGRAIIGMNMPNARLIVLDPQTMSVRTVTPDVMQGHSLAYGSIFVDDTTMFLTVGWHQARCAFLRYPGFEVIESFDAPPGALRMGHRGCLLNGRIYVCAHPTGDLWVLDEESLTWECVCPAFDGGEGDNISALAAHDGRMVCGVTYSGVAVSFDERTQKRDAFELPAVGHCEARALCPVPEVGRVFGAPFITGRFWSLDIETGKGVDLGRGMRGTGQIDFAVWDPAAQLVYMSSYHETNLSVFDPAKPIGWPENPRFLATAHDHEQMRDKALAFDGRHLWMGTAPGYGKLGGALCRIEPASGAIDVRRHIVPDQTINSVILGHGSVYCGSEIHADGKSTPPMQKHAKLICVDPQTMAVTGETTFNEADRLFALAIFDDQLLAQSSDRFFLWNPQTGQVTDLGAAPSVCVNRVVPDDTAGTYWTSDGNSVGRLTVIADSFRYEPVIEHGCRYLHRDRNGTLWFVTRDEVMAFEPEGQF